MICASWPRSELSQKIVGDPVARALVLAHAGDPVEFQEGNTERYYRMERPNVYVNPDTGAVQAFLLSCVPHEDSQSAPTDGASIIIWPVADWKPGGE